MTIRNTFASALTGAGERIQDEGLKAAGAIDPTTSSFLLHLGGFANRLAQKIGDQETLTAGIVEGLHESAPTQSVENLASFTISTAASELAE